jgi:hypothetical protein
MIVAFTAGLIRLFVLRFEAGDVYPPYSTLRSDPLGARALYDSLHNLDAVSVRRNFEPLHRTRFDSRTTLFYLGTSTVEGAKTTVEVFEHLMAEGGRVVVGILPVVRPDGNDKRPRTCRPAPRQQNNPPDETEARESASRCDSRTEPAQNPGEEQDCDVSAWLRKRWGIDIEVMETAQANSDEKSAWTEDSRLPSKLSWHSLSYFQIQDAAWRVLYRCRQYPVIVERSFGKGSLLLMADGYLFSNEALRVERHPDLLSRLIGSNAHLVFDESHLGIYRQPGLAGLIRQYRFHWVIAALAIVAALFVWKNTVYFVPPPDDLDGGSRESATEEKDHTEALVSLLRRNIAARDLLQVCVGEWQKADGGHRRVSSQALDQIQRRVRAAAMDPIAGYQHICRLLSEGNDHE